MGHLIVSAVQVLKRNNLWFLDLPYQNILEEGICNPFGKGEWISGSLFLTAFPTGNYDLLKVWREFTCVDFRIYSSQNARVSTLKPENLFCRNIILVLRCCLPLGAISIHIARTILTTLGFSKKHPKEFSMFLLCSGWAITGTFVRTISSCGGLRSQVQEFIILSYKFTHVSMYNSVSVYGRDKFSLNHWNFHSIFTYPFKIKFKTPKWTTVFLYKWFFYLEP